MRDHSPFEKIEEMNGEKTGAAPDPHRTALVAYEFWWARGCPDGSPEVDWFLAEEHFRHQQNFSLREAA